MPLLRRQAGWVLNFLLVAPLMPKLGFNEDVVIYPYEFVLGVALIVLFIRAPSLLWASATQRALVLYLFIIAISTFIYNLFGFVEIGGWLKLGKLLIYICVPAIVIVAARGDGLLRQMAVVGMLSLALNLYLVFSAGASILGGGLAFDIDMISGGLSGKFINLNSFSLESTGRLSHGVWATYCAFLLALFATLFIRKKIGIAFFLCFNLLLVLNVAASISREGILVFIIVLCGFALRGASLRVASHVYRPQVGRALVIALLLICGSFYAAATQIGQKFMFMLSYLSSGGVDDNLLGRLNTWHLTLLAVSDSIQSFVMGFGYNLDLYALALDKFSSYAGGGVFSHVPESLLFTAFAFGGILGVFALFGLVFALKSDFKRAKIHQSERIFFALFFIGLLLTNIFSGATGTSDLVMLHILLMVGLWRASAVKTGAVLFSGTRAGENKESSTYASAR